MTNALEVLGLQCTLGLLCFITGLVVGRGTRPIAQPRRMTYELTVDRADVLHVYTLTDAQTRAIAQRINAKLPLSYVYMVGKGKAFTRSEWDEARAELIRRGLLEALPGGSVTPRPTARAWARAIAGNYMHK